jgi:hypothetical protein
MPDGQCSRCTNRQEVAEPWWEKHDYVITKSGVIDHESLLSGGPTAERKEELRKLFDNAYKGGK